MPNLTAGLVINDGKVPPVPRTFTMVNREGTLTSLKERIGVPLVYPDLKMSVRPPVKGGEVYKLRFLLALPIPAVGSTGQVIEDYRNTVSIEMMINERCSEEERKDLRVLAINLLTNATVATMVEKLEPIW